MYGRRSVCESRKPRRVLPRWKTIREAIRPAEVATSPTISALSFGDQYDLQQHRHDRRVGRRHQVSSTRACADRRRQSPAPGHRAASRHELFVSARRYRQSDPQFGLRPRLICRSAATISARTMPTPTSSWRRSAMSSPMRASAVAQMCDDQCQYGPNAGPIPA